MAHRREGQVKPWVTPYLRDRKSTRLNSSHDQISYAVFCLKKKNNRQSLEAIPGTPSRPQPKPLTVTRRFTLTTFRRHRSGWCQKAQHRTKPNPFRTAESCG